MINQNFSLEPFEKNMLPYAFSIKGNVTRCSALLHICCKLLGDLSEIQIPEKADIPARKNSLWQNTCMEFFIAVSDLPQYWEFNLSPSGDWNVYSFQNYREGMKEESAFASLPFRVHRQPECFQIDIVCDLKKITDKFGLTEIGISAVVKHKNSELRYWALKHCGSKPDFHLRENFILF